MDETTLLLIAAGGAAAVFGAKKLRDRFILSRAKHPSLRGHARMARRIAKLVPFYEYGEAEFFRCDDAPAEVEARRRRGFERLSSLFQQRSPTSIARSDELADSISDVSFTNLYRVPFQFRERVRRFLQVGCLLDGSSGRQVRDLDGSWSFDLAGAYGMNLFGFDFYKECIDRGVARARELGPVLGPYHPVIADNVARLKAISGLDEVSFHMSGTEAVMQAVRLARYHTGRSHVVRFCGAYHGWWDGVQAGVGNPRPAHEVYTLRDMSEASLRVLRNRDDVACVLVNPIQAMHPNGNAPSDSTLVASDRAVNFDREAYSKWLQQLREVCTERSIPLVFDEVFLGFRLALGGAQEYFGVRADLVTYGKTVGGGLPIGVLCGRRDLMRRFREDRPTDVCFARGTFNSHPYVMATMNEFLRHLDRPEVRDGYRAIDEIWNGRAAALNARLERQKLPVRVANMTSVWTTLFLAPSRYNWMFQYYLRAEGLSMSWIGSGRFIFSHDYTEREFGEVADRYVAAATAMEADGFWWRDAAATNATLRRRVLRETIRAALRRRPSDRSTRPAADATAPCGTA